MRKPNPYYDRRTLAKGVRAGAHRDLVGGMWDEIGRLQFDYVHDNELSRGMRLLDVGCGCLRGGLHFIADLDPGGYHGIDLSQELLDAGYVTELERAGLQHKLPKGNLHCTGDFDASGFGVSFDMALAVSVFTHLPPSHMRTCLARLAEVMNLGSRFFATVFLSPEGAGHDGKVRHMPGGITTDPDRNPFHYRPSDPDACCKGLPWRLEKLESWNHPRDQWMAVFVLQPLPG